MHPEEIQRRLEGLPRRELSPAVEERLRGEIEKASLQRSTPLWSRPIPLWQAAAACLLIGLLVRANSPMPQPTKPDEAPLTQDNSIVAKSAESFENIVFIEKPLFAASNRRGNKTDSSRWKPMRINE